MINPERAGFASQQIARARNTKEAHQRDGGFPNAKLEALTPQAANDTIEWARGKMDSFAAIEAGEDRLYRDADPQPGSIQTNFYDQKLDVTYQRGENGAFSFTEVSSDKSSFDTPFTTTTLVEFDGEKMTRFQTHADAWGEGSTSLQTVTSQGGTEEYYFFG